MRKAIPADISNQFVSDLGALSESGVKKLINNINSKHTTIVASTTDKNTCKKYLYVIAEVATTSTSIDAEFYILYHRWRKYGDPKVTHGSNYGYSCLGQFCGLVQAVLDQVPRVTI